MPFELSSVPAPRVLPKPDVLKSNIVDKLTKLDSLTAEELARVFDLILEIEMERAWKDLCEGMEDDDLSPEAVEAAKLEHRRKHPYGQ